jgi:hypothetical protein
MWKRKTSQEKFKDLISKRDSKYSGATLDLLHSIRPTLEAVIAYMEAEQDAVYWTDVRISSVEDLIRLVGTVNEKYPHIAEQFGNVISIMIPIDLIASGDKERVLNFLREAERKREQLKQTIATQAVQEEQHSSNDKKVLH